MVNSKISFSSGEKEKLNEMKKKIFCLTFTSTIKRVYRRIYKIYFRKLTVVKAQIRSDKKIKTIYDLIRQKLDNKEDFEDGTEENYEIDGKTYTFIKNKNDLIVIDDKGKQKIIENYKEKGKKKKFPYKKQHKLIVEGKESPESGNEPYEESEGEEPEVDHEKIDKKRKDEDESLSEDKKPKRKTKTEIDKSASLEEGEEDERKKKKRPTSEIVKDKKEKRKPKKEAGESIHESEEISEGKTESGEEGKPSKKKHTKGKKPKDKKGETYEEEEDSERRNRFKSPSEKELGTQKKSRPSS